MAGADEGSRIRDVVRGSKIQLDILRKLDRQLGSFNSELNQGTIGIQNRSKQYQTHGRVLPRSAKGVEDCIYVGRLEQNRSPTAGSDRRSHLREANRRWVRSYHPLFKRTSNKEDLFGWFDTVDRFFEETQPLENTKCELASYALEDEAEQWWQQLQHRRRLDGESEIKLWPRMKFLLSNDFWPARCSIKGSPEVENSSKVVNYVNYGHNIPVGRLQQTDKEERKTGCEYDVEAHNNNDEIAMEKIDKFTPIKCSTNYLSNIHLEKSVYKGSTELYNSVSDYSIRLTHGAEGCVKQVEEEKNSSESCHEGDSHGKGQLDEKLKNRGLKIAKCSMEVPSQVSRNEQEKFGCCDSKAEFHYLGSVSDDAYKTHVCEDVLGHDVLIDKKQTHVGKTNEESDKVVGKETSKKYVVNDVDSLVLPTRETSLTLSIAKGPEVGETRLELIYRVLGILHEPLKSIWTYQLGLARNPPLQDHWSCTYVGMGFTWSSFRSKKHAAHFLLLPSMLETCSAGDVFLFDPGGNTYLLPNWSFKKSQLSCSTRLTGSIIGTIIPTLHSSGIIGSIFTNILENTTVDFGKIICDQIEEDITADRVVGVEHEATVTIMALHNVSQAGNAFSTPNGVLRLSSHDVDFLVAEMLTCDFDPDGNATTALMFEGHWNGLNMLSCYHFADQSNNHASSHLTGKNEQRECTNDCRKAACLLRCASASFAELPELSDLRKVFFKKRYWRSAECYVSKEFAYKLMLMPTSKDTKQPLMQDITTESCIKWNPKGLDQALFKHPFDGQEQRQEEKSLIMPEDVYLAPSNADDAPEVTSPIAEQSRNTSTSHFHRVECVAGILKRKGHSHHRSLEPMPMSASGDGIVHALFVLEGSRIPKSRLKILQLRNLINKRVIFAIDSWNCLSRYPSGHYVSLGVTANREAMLQLRCRFRKLNSSYYEVIFLAAGRNISVCFGANTCTESGPFVFALELVIVVDSFYSATEIGTNALKSVVQLWIYWQIYEIPKYSS